MVASIKTKPKKKFPPTVSPPLVQGLTSDPEKKNKRFDLGLCH